MGPITAIIPRPRLVTIGGRRFRVWEFRLRDYAELQGWLDDQWGDPLAEVRELPLDADWETRRPLVIAAHERAEQGPPTVWEMSGRLALATPGGLVMFLWAALRREHPEMTVEAVAELLDSMTPAEFSRVKDICHGDTPTEVAERMIFGPIPSRGGRKVLWPELICETAKEFGYRLAEVYDLTLTEFSALRNGGKPGSGGRELQPGEDAAEVSRRQRERYYGPGATEDAAPAPEPTPVDDPTSGAWVALPPGEGTE